MLLEPTAWPQLRQNFASGGSSVAQLAQTSASLVPHCKQNFASGGFSCWQRGQGMSGALTIYLYLLSTRKIGMAALSFTERQSCIRSSLKNRLLICLAHFRMQTARKKFYRLKRPIDGRDFIKLESNSTAGRR
jgi:hypothetical protein